MATLDTIDEVAGDGHEGPGGGDEEEQEQNQHHQNLAPNAADTSGSSSGIGLSYDGSPLAAGMGQNLQQTPLNLPAEEAHLFNFIQHTSSFFANVLNQKNLFHQKLAEVSNQMIHAGHQTTFAVRVDQLHRIARAYLDPEVVNIGEYFNALWMHHQALASCCTAKRLGTQPKCQLPDMSFVRRTAFQLLDKIIGFQAFIGASLMTPLGFIQVELQGYSIWDLTRTFLAMNPSKEQQQPWSQYPSGAPMPFAPFTPSITSTPVAATAGLVDPFAYGTYGYSVSASPAVGVGDSFLLDSSISGYNNNTNGTTYYSAVHGSHDFGQESFNFGDVNAGADRGEAEAGSGSQPQKEGPVQITEIDGSQT